MYRKILECSHVQNNSRMFTCRRSGGFITGPLFQIFFQIVQIYIRPVMLQLSFQFQIYKNIYLFCAVWLKLLLTNIKRLIMKNKQFTNVYSGYSWGSLCVSVSGQLSCYKQVCYIRTIRFGRTRRIRLHKITSLST